MTATPTKPRAHRAAHVPASSSAPSSSTSLAGSCGGMSMSAGGRWGGGRHNLARVSSCVMPTLAAHTSSNAARQARHAVATSVHMDPAAGTGSSAGWHCLQPHLSHRQRIPERKVQLPSSACHPAAHHLHRRLRLPLEQPSSVHVPVLVRASRRGPLAWPRAACGAGARCACGWQGRW